MAVKADYINQMDKSFNTTKVAFKEFGCFYRIEDGVLLYAAMLPDASIDVSDDKSENWGEVEVSDHQRSDKINEVFGTSFVANCEDGEI